MRHGLKPPVVLRDGWQAVERDLQRFADLADACGFRPMLVVIPHPEELADPELQTRYAGYLEHARHSQAREARLAAVELPPDLAYAQIAGLSAEVREKLERVRPRTLAQAARIPGVTHAALSCVAVELHRRGHGLPGRRVRVECSRVPRIGRGV